MSNLAIALYPDFLQSIAFGAISGAYAAIGDFDNPARIIILQNLTDQQMLFSFDGTNDHLTLPSGGQMIVDLTANKTVTGGAAYIEQGITVYVKQVVAPGSGSVYLSSFYGING